MSFAVSLSCAPPSSSGDGKQGDVSATSDLPEITDEMIRERINGAFIRKVPEENAAAEPITWTFDESEPKEIAVVEKKSEGIRAIIVLDVKTGTAPGVRTPRLLAGQIRTEWELETGLVMRRWQIVNAENVSMKYQNLPKPPAQNKADN